METTMDYAGWIERVKRNASWRTAADLWTAEGMADNSYCHWMVDWLLDDGEFRALAAAEHAEDDTSTLHEWVYDDLMTD
jgi:hypothetical protein